MTVTNNKPQSKDTKVGYAFQEAHLQMVCPNCDSRRSDRCGHRGIPTLKEIKMKALLAIIASVFALSVAAQTAPAKKEEAKPAAAKKAEPAKSEAKAAPAKDAKATK